MVKNKKLVGLLTLILVQLLVVLIILLSDQAIQHQGTPFRVAIDSTDPVESYNTNSITFHCKNMVVTTPILPEGDALQPGERIYVTYYQDATGYAVLDKYYLTMREVPEGVDYLEGEISSVNKITVADNGNKNQYVISLEIPFQTMYFSPWMVKEILQELSEENRNPKGEYYIDMRQKDGHTVVLNTVLDGVNVKDLVSNAGA